MVNEQKAKAYDEALEKAKGLLDSPRTCFDINQLKDIFPQLKESDDEKIRKSLIEFLTIIKEISESGRTTWTVRKGDAEMCKSFIAYLEKQKENQYFAGYAKGYSEGQLNPKQEKQKYDRMQPIYDNRESFESALDKAWKSYNDCGSRTVDSCEDDYIESAYAKGFREGYLFGLEKRKEPENVSASTMAPSCWTEEPSLQKEQKHTLKFKVGDKVHLEGDEINILTITGIEKDRYLTAYGPILFGAEDIWERVEQKPADNPKWTELTWKDIVELEGIINNVHYDFSAGIGQESFGKEVLERFRSTKGIEYLDEAEQKCWREEEQKEQKSAEKHDLVAKLKEHLANTPKEQLEAEWKELEKWNHVGPTVEEYLCGIKPAECEDCAMYLSGNCIHPNGKCENVKSKQEWG